MAEANYEDALRRLLAHEGGYSDHPSDPGGPTNFGITLAVYRKYVDPAADAAVMRAMRIDDAKAIYRTAYWNALRCDALPAGVDYAVFDYGVNSGVARVTKVLRGLLGLAAGGAMDEALLAAVRSQNAGALVAAVCDERLAFLKRLKTWPAFGRGWTRRVADVRSAALALASGASPIATAPAAGGAAAKTAAAGAAATTGVIVATQAHGLGSGIGTVIAVIVLAAVLAGVGWMLWRRRRRSVAAAPITPPAPSISKQKDVA